jgi:hypothetical protein
MKESECIPLLLPRSGGMETATLKHSGELGRICRSVTMEVDAKNVDNQRG